MIKNFLTATFLLLLLLINIQAVSAEAKHNVLGIEIGMSRDDALKRLEKLGKLEREERRQQEIWSLTNEPHYSHIIIGFNKEKTKVRFVTAKARESGRRVRYADVLDIKKVEQTGTTNNYKYQLKVSGHNKTPSYIVIARGTDAKYLTYFSIKESEDHEDGK